jgi:DNA-binding response OmpR family regulator
MERVSSLKGMEERVARILVVEDEASLLAAITYNLRREGHDVLTATDGEQGLHVARQAEPDLLILDLMLPKLDGLEVCRVLRGESAVPILMLTARGEEVDRVVGLELGADDYLTKPFSMRELLARVKALLRRAQMVRHAVAPPERVRVGALDIDLAGRRVTLRGRALTLKPREFDLLAFLAQHPGRVFTREHLLQRVWGYDYHGEARTVDVHVRWLREKLEEDPSSPRVIETVRGVGYRFNAE